MYIFDGKMPRRAKRDIVCFKTVGKSAPHLDGYVWCAPIRGGAYRYDALLQAERETADGFDKVEALCVFVSSDGVMTIDHGFHAFRRPRRSVRGMKNIGLRLAVIPKGAEYCYGEGFAGGAPSVVATHMIVFSSVWSFLKYVFGKKPDSMKVKQQTA